MSNYNIGIYANGLFVDTPIPLQTQLQQISSAGFSTVLFWSLHVHPNGAFYYNNTLLVQNGEVMISQEFISLAQQLKTPGIVKTVLFSIGAWGTSSDFQNIITNIPLAVKNFKALINTLGIDGFDFDYEGDYTPADQKNITTITELLYSLGMKVTYCPYTAQDWWLGCLQQVYARNKQQLVSGYNLQCYAGGAGNDPLQWAQYIQSSGLPTGIVDAASFVLPGYWVQQTGSGDGQCPTTMQQTFASFSGKGLAGGWCWNTGDVFTNETTGLCGSQQTLPANYAQAITAGLSSKLKTGIAVAAV